MKILNSSSINARESWFNPEDYRNKDVIFKIEHKIVLRSCKNYSKRFTETRLGKDFIILIKEIKKNGFISMCIPWGELVTNYLIDIKIVKK